MTTGQAHIELDIGSGLLIDNRPASLVQTEKYNRILQGAFELADVGGYDALQMRAVSERSGVAVATIYRYFQSRDHLAYVLSTAWMALMVAEAGPARTQPVSDLQGLTSQIHRSAKALGEHPRMLETYARSSLTRDPSIVDRIKQRTETTTSFAMPVPQGVDPEDWQTMLRHMGQVFFSGIVQWAHGQKKYEEIPYDVASVANLVATALRLFPKQPRKR